MRLSNPKEMKDKNELAYPSDSIRWRYLLSSRGDEMSGDLFEEFLKAVDHPVSELSEAQYREASLRNLRFIF